MGAPIINSDEFAAFILVLSRISILLALAPIFGSPNIPVMAKAALVLTLTFMIAPHVNYDANYLPTQWLAFIPLILGELILGFSLAFIVRLILEGANMAGDYISFQMGLSMANVIDPQSGAQLPITSRLIYLSVILIFLAVNGHLLLIETLIKSFNLLPPGYIKLVNLKNPEIIIRTFAAMYVFGLKLAAPAIAVLFCIKISFGIVSKAVPQMNVLFVGVPVYIMVGLIMVILSLPLWSYVLSNFLVEIDKALNLTLTIFQGN